MVFLFRLLISKCIIRWSMSLSLCDHFMGILCSDLIYFCVGHSRCHGSGWHLFLFIYIVFHIIFDQVWSIFHHVSFLRIVGIIELKIIILSIFFILYINISHQPMIVFLKLHSILFIRTWRFVRYCLEITHRLLSIVLKIVIFFNIGVNGIARLFVLHHWALFLNVALIIGGVFFPKAFS